MNTEREGFSPEDQSQESEVQLYPDYNREMDPKFHTDLENFLEAVPQLRGHVYSLIDTIQINTARADMDYYSRLIRESLKQRKLKDDEVALLEDMYKKKLEDLWNRATEFNAKQENPKAE